LKSEILRFAQVALGERPAQQVFRGGRVLNVYTGQIIEETVALFQDRIAYVARAVNEVVKMGEGLGIVNRGKVLGRLGLPVGGLMSDKPAPANAAYREMNRLFG